MNISDTTSVKQDYSSSSDRTRESRRATSPVQTGVCLYLYLLLYSIVSEVDVNTHVRIILIFGLEAVSNTTLTKFEIAICDVLIS
ncbi:hypothetical protein BJX68DRAFT_32580 [Aspergillus pseudodeflectus]|uniref:Uncharacterized protein n=1 Tax=Aspergillus pseudodeflectus TaxID=176178 RepID=A0ABR4KU07_9EURO